MVVVYSKDVRIYIHALLNEIEHTSSFWVVQHEILNDNGVYKPEYKKYGSERFRYLEIFSIFLWLQRMGKDYSKSHPWGIHLVR